MYDPFGGFSLLDQTSSSASSSLNIYDPFGGLSLLEQTSSSASSSFNIYDPFDCFSSSLDQATNHINGQLYDHLGCDSSSSCLDAATSIVSSQFDGQYSSISPASSLGHQQNQNNYSSMINDPLDMGNVIYNINNNNNINDNLQHQINQNQHCQGNNNSNNVIYYDSNNSLNNNNVNVNINSSSINQQLQNYQHQLNHKLQTNTGSGASKRSVLMNLLIDGSDVGAGYTSHNCRALPQMPRANQLRL